MLWLLFVILFTLDVYDSSLPALPSRTVNPAGQSGQPPTHTICQAAGQLPPEDFVPAPVRDRPGAKQCGHRWYRNHLGLETAREHSFRGSPRRGHAQHPSRHLEKPTAVAPSQVFTATPLLPANTGHLPGGAGGATLPRGRKRASFILRSQKQS